MNRLMTTHPLMDETDSEPTGGSGESQPTESQPTESQTTESQPAQESQAPAQESQAPAAPDKPYLGESGQQTASQPTATPPSEADYLKAVVKDEALLGKDSTVQIDQNLVKAVIPEAQKLGVSPETLNKLANTLAKAQLDGFQKASQGRGEYYSRMKDESMRKYNPHDFEQINAGIDHWFKPGGVMNKVIRNSELGADPEFLALMHYLGSRRDTDSLQGAESGGGENAGDPNGIGGISKLW